MARELVVIIALLLAVVIVFAFGLGWALIRRIHPAEVIDRSHPELCAKCGKQFKSEDHGFIQRETGVVQCVFCTADSLPEDDKNAIYSQLKWSENLRLSVEPNLVELREKGILKPISDLLVLWSNSCVHTSLTALTHEEHGEAFRIQWNSALEKGVVHFDIYARNFNEGIKYSNIRMSGLADFEHLEQVTQDKIGYALFARSIAEALIVAVHAGINWGCSRALIGKAIMLGLVDTLDGAHGNWKRFYELWERESLDSIVQDVEAALVSDTLLLQRFVRSSELFVLAKENWL
jgi:hypothetical protein